MLAAVRSGVSGGPRWLFIAFAAASAIALCVGCDQNQAGNVGATKLGDTSRPAERGSPLTALQEACAASGTMLTSGLVTREPYLQGITATDATVGWVTTAADGQAVEITRPDGAPILMAAAEPELAAVRTAGEKQVWSQIGGLEPDTVYCYRVMREGEAITERIGFRTAPTAESTRPIRVMAFGDSGGGGGDQFALREQMEAYPYELIVHTGDLAYETGSLDAIEKTVFDVYTGLFRHLPFFPASGNHDYQTLQGAPFRDVFSLPENGDSEKWYSFDYGRIHFVALDTEADYRTQIEWLDQDLAANQLPWKIVYMHRPPYSSGNHGSDTTLRNLLAPIVEKHGVQLVLTGHDHHYERMLPQNGVNYVVTGGGGRGTYSTGASSFTGFAESVIHYVYFEVGTDELVLHAIDAEGTEFDSMVIPRGA